MNEEMNAELVEEQSYEYLKRQPRPLYPDPSLKKQVRPIEETQSVWDVILKTFWPSRK